MHLPRTLDSAAVERSAEKTSLCITTLSRSRNAVDFTGAFCCKIQVRNQKRIWVRRGTNISVRARSDKRAELSKLNGADFGKAYVANEIAYHKTINGALATTLIPSASNPEPYRRAREIGLLRPARVPSSTLCRITWLPKIEPWQRYYCGPSGSPAAPNVALTAGE
jgi:hypothetical protein